MLPTVEGSVLVTITGFLAEIGLHGGTAALEGPTILPGVDIVEGQLVVDEARLLYPGDLLHEAGHLAVVSSAERRLLNGNVGGAGEEMAAIAWSWAALVHLGLAPEVVFHEAGYRGGSRAIVEAFSARQYFGVPLLEWMGLTLTGTRAAENDVPPFPHMRRWLRD